MKTLKISLFAAAAFFFTMNATAQEKKAVSKKAVVKTETKAPNVKPTGVPATLAPATAAPAQDAPMGITFSDDTHTFGDIDKDKPVSYEFTFKNTSDKPVLITGVKPSCGCTATSYTKTVVKPGESGSVTATYNAHNPGPFTKTLTVSTNDTGATKTLYIKGKVISTEAPPAAVAPAAPASQH